MRRRSYARRWAIGRPSAQPSRGSDSRTPTPTMKYSTPCGSVRRLRARRSVSQRSMRQICSSIKGQASMAPADAVALMTQSMPTSMQCSQYGAVLARTRRCPSSRAGTRNAQGSRRRRRDRCSTRGELTSTDVTLRRGQGSAARPKTVALLLQHRRRQFRKYTAGRRAVRRLRAPWTSRRGCTPYRAGCGQQRGG